tara:strand:+ start:636 stop:764 length:129 start_codon:yes stop_codon:yes gene_type:complete
MKSKLIKIISDLYTVLDEGQSPSEDLANIIDELERVVLDLDD